MADLGIEFTGPDQVVTGESLSLGLTVTNAGPDPSQASLGVGLPAGVTPGTAGTSGCGFFAGALICSLTLSAGASVPVSFSVVPTTAGVLTFDASISGPLDDPDVSNNMASKDVTAADAALEALAVFPGRAVLPPGGSRLFRASRCPVDAGGAPDVGPDGEPWTADDQCQPASADWTFPAALGTPTPATGSSTVLDAGSLEGSGQLTAAFDGLTAGAPIVVIASTDPAKLPLHVHQLDWLRDDGASVEPCTRAGIATFSPGASMAQCLGANGGCYVNLTIDDPGSGPQWIVQNLYLAYPDARYMRRSRPGVQIPLPTSGGQCLDRAMVGASVTSFPLFTWAVPPATRARVRARDYLTGGGIRFGGGDGGGSDDAEGPPAARPYTGPAPGAEAVASASTAVASKDLLKVDEAVGGCVPGALTRSLQYLFRDAKGRDRPDRPKDMYRFLTRRLGTDPAGTDPLDIIARKNEYTDTLPREVETTLFLTPLDGVCNDEVIRNLAAGCDVEALIRFKPKAGHMAMVTSMTAYDSGQCDVTWVDDPTQGDGKAETAERKVTTDAAGDFGDGAIGGYVVECLKP